MCMTSCPTGANSCRSVVKIHKSLEFLVVLNIESQCFYCFLAMTEVDRNSLRAQCGKVRGQTMVMSPYCILPWGAQPAPNCCVVPHVTPHTTLTLNISSGQETQDRESDPKCRGCRGTHISCCRFCLVLLRTCRGYPFWSLGVCTSIELAMSQQEVQSTVTIKGWRI